MLACLYFFSLMDTFIKLNSPDKEPTVEEKVATFRPLQSTKYPLDACANAILKRLINSKYCCGYRKQEDREDWEHIRKTHHH